MILRDFIKADYYYIFNPSDGTANRTKIKDMCMSGYFAVLDNGECAAIYKESNHFVLQIGKQQWTFNEAIQFNYYHLDSGSTHFSIEVNNNIEYEINYNSWWRSEGHNIIVPAFGAPDDADQDIFAYVYLLQNSKNMRDGLINIWEDMKTDR